MIVRHRARNIVASKRRLSPPPLTGISVAPPTWVSRALLRLCLGRCARCGALCHLCRAVAGRLCQHRPPPCTIVIAQRDVCRTIIGAASPGVSTRRARPPHPPRLRDCARPWRHAGPSTGSSAAMHHGRMRASERETTRRLLHAPRASPPPSHSAHTVLGRAWTPLEVRGRTWPCAPCGATALHRPASPRPSSRSWHSSRSIRALAARRDRRPKKPSFIGQRALVSLSSASASSKRSSGRRPARDGAPSNSACDLRGRRREGEEKAKKEKKGGSGWAQAGIERRRRRRKRGRSNARAR